MSRRRTELEIAEQSPLSAIVRKERKLLGLTQDQMAARTGVSIGFYKKLEVGDTNLQYAKILKVLAFLNIKIDFEKIQVN